MYKRQAYTCGNNFTSKLIEHAGGVNIFNDLDTTWATVSWETVVERAPEVIVINDYGDTTLEEKIAQLKENPALATVPAIQNDRIISVKLCEVFASSMTGDTVEKFARALRDHYDDFNDFMRRNIAEYEVLAGQLPEAFAHPLGQ